MAGDIHNSGPAGAVYGLGFIGAAIYYIGRRLVFGQECWGF